MRKIRFNDGVFNRIIASDREFSGYDRFINTQKGIRSDRRTEELVNVYKEMTHDHGKTFEQLAHLEDLIILYRIKLNLDVELYIQSHKGRDYIYARQACPRDTKNKDIRVCVGRSDIYPKDVNPLESAEVLEKAEGIVVQYINELIREKEFIVQHLVKDYTPADGYQK